MRRIRTGLYTDGTFEIERNEVSGLWMTFRISGRPMDGYCQTYVTKWEAEEGVKAMHEGETK